MPRKAWTDEERKAFGEKMRQLKSKKEMPEAAPQTNTMDDSPKPENTQTQNTISLSQEQFDQLLNRIAVAEAAIANKGITADQAINAKAEMQGVSMGRNGLQGVIYKWPIEQDYYPDPSERILNMPELARYAPHMNYEIKWEVSGVEYEKANINYAEPRFKVQILRVMFDDYGQPTNKRAIVGTHYQHEDENVVRMIARDMGLDTTDERALMDEVRFQRIRRWVLDLLTPFRQADKVESISEMVIDGKVIPVIDVSTNADKQVAVNIDATRLQA